MSVLWNVFVMGGTAYLVFWRGQNPWWFALAVFLLASSGKAPGVK